MLPQENIFQTPGQSYSVRGILFYCKISYRQLATLKRIMPCTKLLGGLMKKPNKHDREKELLDEHWAYFMRYEE